MGVMTIHQHLLAGVFPGGDWEIGCYTDTDTGTLPGAHTAWTNAVAELWGPPTGGIPSVGDFCLNTYVATNIITYTLVPGGTQKVNKASTSINVPGTSTIEALPCQVSWVVTFLASGTAIPNRGRMYLPAFDTFFVSAGAISAPAGDNVLGAVKAGLAKLTVDSYTPVVFDRKHARSNPIDSLRLDLFPGVRSSRRNSLTPAYRSLAL